LISQKHGEYQMSQSKYWIAFPDKDGPMVERKNVYIKPSTNERVAIGPDGKEIFLTEKNYGTVWFELELSARQFCENYWTTRVETTEADLDRLVARLDEVREDLKFSRVARRRAHNALYKLEKRIKQQEL